MNRSDRLWRDSFCDQCIDGEPLLIGFRQLRRGGNFHEKIVRKSVVRTRQSVAQLFGEIFR